MNFQSIVGEGRVILLSSTGRKVESGKAFSFSVSFFHSKKKSIFHNINKQHKREKTVTHLKREECAKDGNEERIKFRSFS